MDYLANALFYFWNKFGIKAYPQFNIPDDAKMPYIVYNISTANTLEVTNNYIKIYYKKTPDDMKSMLQLADAIAKEIGFGKTIYLSNSSGTVIGNVVLFQIEFQQVEDTERSFSLYGSFQMEHNYQNI